MDGNRRVRAAMVELAWLWLRWQPDSILSAWFRARVGKAGGRIKKIMIVALARSVLQTHTERSSIWTDQPCG
jgi:transposase